MILPTYEVLEPSIHCSGIKEIVPSFKKKMFLILQ